MLAEKKTKQKKKQLYIHEYIKIFKNITQFVQNTNKTKKPLVKTRKSEQKKYCIRNVVKKKKRKKLLIFMLNNEQNNRWLFEGIQNCDK